MLLKIEIERQPPVPMWAVSSYRDTTEVWADNSTLETLLHYFGIDGGSERNQDLLMSFLFRAFDMRSHCDQSRILPLRALPHSEGVISDATLIQGWRAGKHRSFRTRFQSF